MEDALVKAVQAAVKAEVGQMEDTVRRVVREELGKITPAQENGRSSKDRLAPMTPPPRVTLAKISSGARTTTTSARARTTTTEETKHEESGGEPHASFSHQARDGTWAPYSDEQCSLIAGAIDASPAGGVVRLPGIPFEIRWGCRATSVHVTSPPPTGMLQVNLKNENTHYVRRDAIGARAADKAREGPASLRACVAPPRRRRPSTCASKRSATTAPNASARGCAPCRARTAAASSACCSRRAASARAARGTSPRR